MIDALVLLHIMHSEQMHVKQNTRMLAADFATLAEFVLNYFTMHMCTNFMLYNTHHNIKGKT